MSLTTFQQQKPKVLATSDAPGLLQQLGMAGTAAVITVTFIHPIDVIKVSKSLWENNCILFTIHQYPINF